MTIYFSRLFLGFFHGVESLKEQHLRSFVTKKIILQTPNFWTVVFILVKGYTKHSLNQAVTQSLNPLEFFALVLSVLVFSWIRILVCLAGRDADLALSRAASSLALSFSCRCCSILASWSRLFIRSSSTRACLSASKARLRSWKIY